MTDTIYKRMKEYPVEYALEHLKGSTAELSREEMERIRDNLCYFACSVPSQWSSELKLRLVYNVITKVVIYDRKNPRRYSYVGCFEGRALCMGVAELMTLLLRALRIKCMTVVGFGGNYVTGEEEDDDYHGPHSWNIVWLEDELTHKSVPYHIDATWDLQKDSFLFYLKNDEYMKSTGHYWLAERYPECTATSNIDGKNINKKVVDIACQIFPRETSSV